MEFKTLKEWIENPLFQKEKIIANKIYLKKLINLCKENDLVENFKYDKEIIYHWDKFYTVLNAFFQQFENANNWNKISIHIDKIDSEDKSICALYDYDTETIILNYNVLIKESHNNILMSLNHEYAHYLDHSLNKLYNKNFISDEPYSQENLRSNNTPALFIKSFIAGNNIRQLHNKYSEKDFAESLLIYALVNKSEKLLNKISSDFVDETLIYLFEILLKEQKYFQFNIMKYLNETLEQSQPEEEMSFKLSEIEKEYDRTKYRILKKLKIQKQQDDFSERKSLLLPKHEHDFYTFFSYIDKKAEIFKFTKDERREFVINIYYNIIYFNINKSYDLKAFDISKSENSNMFALYNMITMNGNHYTEHLSPLLMKNINNRNVDFNYITNIPEMLAYSIEANPDNILYTFGNVVFNKGIEFDKVYAPPSYSSKEIEISKHITSAIRGFIEKYNIRNFDSKEKFKQNPMSQLKEELSVNKKNLINMMKKKNTNEGKNPFEQKIEKKILEHTIKEIRKKKLKK